MRSRNVTFWVGGILIAISASTAGVLLGRSRGLNVGSKVMIEFDTSALSRGVLQGEVIAVPFAVVNSGNQPITVQSIEKSCGCLSIVGEDGGALSLPIKLLPGSDWKGRVSLSTDSKQGLAIQPVGVQYDCAGRVYTVTGELKVHVCAGPHSLTGPIVLNSDHLEGTATIGAAFPTPVELSDVIVESHYITSAKLERLKPQIRRDTASKKRSSPCKIFPTYKVHVVSKPSDRDFRALVKILPSDANRRAIYLPVHFRASRSEGSLMAFPSAVILRPSDSVPVVREIHILRNGGNPSQVKVSSSTPYIQTVVEDRGRIKIVKITIRSIDRLQEEEFVTVKAVSGNESKIPVKVLSER